MSHAFLALYSLNTLHLILAGFLLVLGACVPIEEAPQNFSISSISPSSGDITGGYEVSISGSKFSHIESVEFGGVPCTGVSVLQNEITCTVPSTLSAGAVTVAVRGKASRNASTAFTYIMSAPTVTSFSPTLSALDGGASIFIYGTGFGTGAIASVDGTPCDDTNVLSSTLIECISPSMAAGSYAVAVTNVNGMSDTAAVSIAYNAAPTVTSVTPDFDSVAGGTTLTVTGTGFFSGARVYAGTISCGTVTVVNATTITCVTATAGTGGTFNLRVVNSDNQVGTLTNGFTYYPVPTLSSISPSAGALAGGTTLTVNGSNLTADSLVDVDGQPCTPVTFISATRVTCLTPANVAGTYGVTVMNPGTTSATLAAAYTYQSAPTVTAVSPNAGALAGGTTLTITGTDFLASATVSVGSASCAVSALTATSITCTTTANTAGTYAVTVTNPDGQPGSLAGAYTYQVAPVVTSITPAIGPLTGLTSVTITGSNFLTGQTVEIGGAACTVTAESATSITCDTGVSTSGVKDVVVENPDGQTGTLSNGFTYLSPPTVASVSPNAGALAGTTSITITGTDFFTGVDVDVDGTDCSNVVVVNSTTITCDTPAKAAGTYDIVVTNVDGQTDTLASSYTYQEAPSVASVVAANGPAGGGTSVTITGADFLPGATVDFDGADCATTSILTGTIVCTTSAHAAGAVTITVTNTDGQSGSLGTSYTYDPAPTVTSVDISVGPFSGSTLITITGTDFVATPNIEIGGTPCGGVTFNSATELECTTAATAAGTYDIVVENPDLQTGTLTNGFTFLDPPTVTSISPVAGALAGGNTITITGTNFVSGSVPTVDGAACTTFTVVNSTSITCQVPAHAAGAVAVVVTNPDAANDSSTYTYQTAPTVTSVVASSGPMTGGTAVTVNGTGFVNVGAIAVDFGGVACAGVTWTSATTLTCTTAAHAAGAVTVTVTNADGQSGNLASAFTYDPYPTIANITPIIGPVGGGQILTINGTDFRAGATVTVGGAPCTLPTVSATQITCTTPAGAAGAQTVIVTNSDGLDDSFASYTYLNPPTLVGVSPVGGLPSGGTSVTITGTDFLSGASVTFNGAACTSVTVVNSSTITCITPAGAVGAATVVVTNIDSQSDSSAALYEYNFAPAISNLTPNFGPIGGNTSVTIAGSGFINGATATFGSAAPVACTFNSVNSLTCLSPSTLLTGPVAVTVTNPDSQSHTLTPGFIYLGPPTISSISPHVGPLAGGGTVTISGSNFVAGATVTIGGVACTSVNVTSTTTLTCTVAAAAAGSYNIVVTNIDGQSVTEVSGYTYQGAPTVTSISPDNGHFSGGTPITITGTNFASGASVTLTGVACNSITVVNSTTITCTTAASPAGTYTAQVTNVDGQFGTLASAYTYRNSPIISNISPTSGPVGGGVDLYVNGTGFFVDDVITINGQTCTTVTFVSANQIRCTTPNVAVAGVYGVTITSSDRTNTLSSAYTYRDPATVVSVSPSSGALAGNTLITITGTNFVAGAIVRVDGNNCPSVTVVNSTTITCRTPAGTAGAKTVSVTLPNMLAVTLAAGYTYVAAPIIDFHVGTISPTPPNPDSYGSTSTNVTHTFTVRNTGEAATTDLAITIIGTNPGAWIIGTNACGAVLANGASCTVQVTFIGAFLSSGSYTATLRAIDSIGGTVTNSILGTVP